MSFLWFKVTTKLITFVAIYPKRFISIVVYESLQQTSAAPCGALDVLMPVTQDKKNIMPLTKSIKLFYCEAFPMSYHFAGSALTWQQLKSPVQ